MYEWMYECMIVNGVRTHFGKLHNGEGEMRWNDNRHVVLLH